MSSVNVVILIGNLTRDPVSRNLPGGGTVTEFGLATNRKFKGADGADREEVCYVDCAAFGRQAEVIAEHFRKGKPIYVAGRLRLDQWEDKQGGGKRSKLSVVVDRFEFLPDGSAPGAGGGGNSERHRERGGPVTPAGAATRERYDRERGQQRPAPPPPRQEARSGAGNAPRRDPRAAGGPAAPRAAPPPQMPEFDPDADLDMGELGDRFGGSPAGGGKDADAGGYGS